MVKYLTLFLIITTKLFAESTTFDNSYPMQGGLTIISETSTGIEIVYSLEELSISDFENDGALMKTIAIPGAFLPNQEGAPNLPSLGRFIAIPQYAQAKVIVLSKDTEVHHNLDIAPAPNIPLEIDDTPLRYEKDMSKYGLNALYPEAPVVLSKPMKMRGVDVVILGITPFQYNPVTEDLIVYKNLHIYVDFVGGNGHFGEDRLRSPYWEHILQGHLINYKSLPKIDFFNPSRLRDGYEYIIIVPDDSVFERWGDTIKAWRKLQGISSEVFTLSQIGGNTVEAIESFIDSAYSNWSVPPVAVLLLSDYETSGKTYGITSKLISGPYPYVSDNWYADVDGDSLPELNIARITAQTDTHLSVMVNKFLSYERSPYTASNFYKEPLVSCGFQHTRWFQITAEIIREFFKNCLGADPAREYNWYG